MSTQAGASSGLISMKPYRAVVNGGCSPGRVNASQAKSAA